MQLLAGLLLGTLISAVAGGLLLTWLLRKTRALERRTAEAERLAELGTLTGGLAHEIKNPLSTLQLNLQLLRDCLALGRPGRRRPPAKVRLEEALGPELAQKLVKSLSVDRS